MDLSCMPCRVVHCYKIENEMAYIIGFDGIVHLNSTATVVWQMSNGKNSINRIIEKLHEKYEGTSTEELYVDVEDILNTLVSKGVLIMDWDPLLKDNVFQKEKYT